MIKGAELRGFLVYRLGARKVMLSATAPAFMQSQLRETGSWRIPKLELGN